MLYTYENSDTDPKSQVSLEKPGLVIPFEYNRVISGDIAGAGDQFRPPRSQTSWPRHDEIATEDLGLQNSTAGDLAVGLNSIPRPHPAKRIDRSRGGSRSTPYLASSFRYQPCSEEGVALLIEHRDRPQRCVAHDGTYFHLFVPACEWVTLSSAMDPKKTKIAPLIG